jgi:hypothetical protein
MRYTLVISSSLTVTTSIDDDAKPCRAGASEGVVTQQQRRCRQCHILVPAGIIWFFFDERIIWFFTSKKVVAARRQSQSPPINRYIGGLLVANMEGARWENI